MNQHPFASRAFTAAAIAAGLLLAVPARAVDQTGFNTDLGFANDVTNAFNGLFGGAFNAVHGSNNNLFGGAWNLTMGSQLTIGDAAFWNFNGGNSNSTTGQFNFLWGKGLSDGGLKGSVLFGDSDPFGIRVGGAPNPFTNIKSETFNGSFTGGYYLFSDDGQGANANNGLFVVPSGVNAAGQTFTSRLGVNTTTPGEAIHIGVADSTTSRAMIQMSTAIQTWRFGADNDSDFRIHDVTGDVVILSCDDAGSGFIGFAGRNNPAFPLHVGTDTDNGNGAHVTNGGIWTNGSSREFKEDFADVDTRDVLRKVAELPVQTWRYKKIDGERHMGPVAEDFREAFGLGHDEQYIGTVDIDGVALAAIQGLNEVVEEKDARIAELEASQEKLEARMANLEKLLEKPGE